MLLVLTTYMVEETVPLCEIDDIDPDCFNEIS